MAIVRYFMNNKWVDFSFTATDIDKNIKFSSDKVIIENFNTNTTGEVATGDSLSVAISKILTEIGPANLFQRYVLNDSSHEISDSMIFNGDEISFLNTIIQFPQSKINMKNATDIDTGAAKFHGSNWQNTTLFTSQDINVNGNILIKGSIIGSGIPYKLSNSDNTIISTIASLNTTNAIPSITIGDATNNLVATAKDRPKFTTNGTDFKYFAFTDDTNVVNSLTPIALTSGKDMNTIIATGWYYCNTEAIAKSLANCPTTAVFSLEVLPWDDGRIIQRISDFSTGTLYIRGINSDGTTWGVWRAIGIDNLIIPFSVTYDENDQYATITRDGITYNITRNKNGDLDTISSDILGYTYKAQYDTNENFTGIIKSIN